LEKLQSFLKFKDGFGETEAVDLFEKLPQLWRLTGLAAAVTGPDRLWFEYQVGHLLRADFVCGSTASGQVAFIEFESGENSDIFKASKDNQRLPDWARRTEHAFSQISDWMWLLDQYRGSSFQETDFGTRRPKFTFVVICGRSAGLADQERQRLDWRSSHTLVAGHPVRFWTWDDFCNQLRITLQGISGT
jgi:hypothetical protein